MQNGHITKEVGAHFQLPRALGLRPMPLITSQLQWAEPFAIGLAIGENIYFFFLPFFLSFPRGNGLRGSAVLSKLFLAARPLRHLMAAWGILSVRLINHYSQVANPQRVFKGSFDWMRPLKTIDVFISVQMCSGVKVPGFTIPRLLHVWNDFIHHGRTKTSGEKAVKNVAV